MLKASALYIVIILSLVIAILCGSLISTAYFYRLEYQKSRRYGKLLTNLNSGLAIILSKDFKPVSEEETIDLFEDQTDSVTLRKAKWGVFDLAFVQSFSGRDSLSKAFLIGKETERDKATLYLMDEDRPLSVSGTTKITGEAYLPKAGIKEAYVEGKSFKGEKLVNGTIKTSKNKLPALDTVFLDRIQKRLSEKITGNRQSLPDSLSNSFFNSERVFKLPRSEFRISNKALKGRITIVSDTLVRIDKSSRLEDVIIYAPAIVVEDGFKGSCQLFAVDSIVTGANSVFNYPSCLAVLRPEENPNIQPRITVGKKTVFAGIVFSYEKETTDMQTLITLGENSLVKGEVYASGLIKFNSPATVLGKVACKRFLIQTEISLYENYLIDILLDRNKRSRYYLSSSMFTENASDENVLKWVD